MKVRIKRRKKEDTGIMRTKFALKIIIVNNKKKRYKSRSNATYKITGIWEENLRDYRPISTHPPTPSLPLSLYPTPTPTPSLPPSLNLSLPHSHSLTCIVLRIISLWSSPSNGNLPHKSKNIITPTDHRSASFPYPCIVST